MAKQTFKNEGGGVHFTFAGGGEGVRVEAGETYTTEDEEVKTALRKSGQFSKVSSSKEKK